MQFGYDPETIRWAVTVVNVKSVILKLILKLCRNVYETYALHEIPRTKGSRQAALLVVLIYTVHSRANQFPQHI